jgi:hypothetical protein
MTWRVSNRAVNPVATIRTFMLPIMQQKQLHLVQPRSIKHGKLLPFRRRAAALQSALQQAPTPGTYYSLILINLHFK